MRRDAVKYMFDARQGEADFTHVRAMRTNVIHAGDTLELEAYPVIRGRVPCRRPNLHGPTSKAQRAVNKRRRAKKLRRLIECNFTERDYVVHGTYRYEHPDAWHNSHAEEEARYERDGIPWSMDDAQRDVTKYLRKIRDRQRRRDPDDGMRYAYVIEPTAPSAEGLPDHFHFHMVLHASQLTADEIKEFWPHEWVRVDALCLRPGGPGAERLANYLTKANEASRLYTSHGLKQPIVETSDKILFPALAARIAGAVERRDEGLFSALKDMYPGYQMESAPRVWFSDFLPGAYIEMRLRRTEAADISAGIEALSC